VNSQRYDVLMIGSTYMKEIEIVLQNKENAKVLLSAFQTILDNSTDMMFIKNQDLTYLGASMPFVKMLGKNTVEEIIDHTDMELFDDPDLALRYVKDDRKLFSSGENLIDFIESLPEVDGHAHYGTTSKYILKDEAGATIGLLGITRDITKDILAKQSHQKELEYLFDLPEDTYMAVFMDINDWHIISERKQRVHDYELPSYHSIQELLDSVTQVVPSNTPIYEFFMNFNPQHLRKIYESGKRNFFMEYPRKMPDGTLRWSVCEFTFLLDPENSHLCLMVAVRDIDPHKQSEYQIRKAAATDEMTGLLNRAATMKQIQTFLHGDGAEGTHALMIIDVDNFKEINDTLGHRAGDQYLIDFAKTTKRCFRSDDIIGRIGGDEFFVLMKNVSSRVATEERAALLLKAMQTAGNFDESLHVSGSIGICFYRGDNSTLDQLYERADQALYEAKRQGKNRVVFVDDLY